MSTRGCVGVCINIKEIERERETGKGEKLMFSSPDKEFGSGEKGPTLGHEKVRLERRVLDWRGKDIVRERELVQSPFKTWGVNMSGEIQRGRLERKRRGARAVGMYQVVVELFFISFDSNWIKSQGCSGETSIDYMCRRRACVA